MYMRPVLITVALVGGLVALALGMQTIGILGQAASADESEPSSCPVTYQALKTALQAADTADSTGLNNHYWAVVVNRDGVVCAVAFSGPARLA